MSGGVAGGPRSAAWQRGLPEQRPAPGLLGEREGRAVAPISDDIGDAVAVEICRPQYRGRHRSNRLPAVTVEIDTSEVRLEGAVCAAQHPDHSEVLGVIRRDRGGERRQRCWASPRSPGLWKLTTIGVLWTSTWFGKGRPPARSRTRTSPWGEDAGEIALMQLGSSGGFLLSQGRQLPSLAH